MKYAVVLILFGVLAPALSVKDPNLQLENFVQSFKKAGANLNKGNLQLSDDVGLSISEYLQKYNYPLENHEVTTEDGFILTLHRIPSGRSSTLQEGNKPAALFVHGLVSCPIDWVTQGPEKSLALLMADLGYDIWLLGTRASPASMKHLTFNSSEAEFWDFSFHEKGYYDIAASVDFILETTGLAKIALVGHSEGTSESMALTTTRPEYNDKLNLVVLLSPIGYMGGVISPIPVFLTKHMAAIKVFLVDVLKINGIPYIEGLSNLLVSVCSIDGFGEVCNDFLKLLCGDDQDQTELDYLLVFVSSKPAGVSVKELLHYGQEIVDATFRQYDYGLLGNLGKYGEAEPPIYNASLITAPVAAYYASNDYFAAVEDVENLLALMPNVADKYMVENEYFNHLDFLSSKDVKTLLYDRVISIMKDYNPL